MRQIIFRGKRVDNGEWVYGYLVSKKYILQEYRVEYGYILPYNRFEVIPETVGQYTGINDIDDCKIFEKDIVTDKDGEIFLIMFSKNGYFVAINDDYWEFVNDLDEIKVIGNIHDNGELLEEKK